MRPIFALAALLAALSSGQARAGDFSDESGMGWQLERDVDSPRATANDHCAILCLT